MFIPRQGLRQLTSRSLSIQGTHSMEQSFADRLYQQHLDTPPSPPAKWVAEWFDSVLGLLFPQTSALRFADREAFQLHIQELKKNLTVILSGHCGKDMGRYAALADEFFVVLDEVKSLLDKDAQAMFEGDPAANSLTEVVRSYPGFYAIAAHRMANALLKMGVTLVPRALAEHAHRITGIDINPGATIGQHFCIDHGTGVVIGETSVIGNHVKIYQGVTLGALSVDKKDATSKRHPTIEDNVVIYAGATILGGSTVVGEGSVVGGNVWLTRSIPPYTKVYYSAKMTNEDGEVDTVVLK